MVWFYPAWNAVALKDQISFQSHYGLILSSWQRSKNKGLLILSIPLWSDFIRRFHAVKLLEKSIFQSHYGLILSTSIIQHNGSQRKLSIPLWSDFISSPYASASMRALAFNPTMVWFYLEKSVITHRCGSYFQSHYGLILSKWKVGEVRPHGTLSIPLWSDFITEKAAKMAGLLTLSIPLWSDFIPERVILYKCKTSFQSHYGLILSNSTIFELLNSLYPFNPTMVWFYQR